MTPGKEIELSYYPGCSLATSAKEANQSLIEACRLLGVKLIELEDWNCCGSSSAHMLDPDLALGLAARNLSIAPPDRPLMVMCPSCYKNLRLTREKLEREPSKRRALERRWDREFRETPPVVSFLEIIRFLDRMDQMSDAPADGPPANLRGLKIAPYYGCMLAMPPHTEHARNLDGLMEKTLTRMGGEVIYWGQRDRCCGTFLSAARPEVATRLVDSMMSEAIRRGAECIVTACAMCQLNLEIRCSLSERLPSLHLSEMMALALGAGDHRPWFQRHLVNPVPLLRRRSIIA